MTKPLMHSKTAEAKIQERKRIVKNEVKPALLQTQSLEEKLARPVSSLKWKGMQKKISSRAQNCLENAGVKTLGDLVKLTDESLKGMRYLRGDYTLKVLKAELNGLGLRLGMGNEVEYLKKSRLLDNLAKSVDELNDLSVRSANCLQNLGFRYMFELVQKTEADLLRVRDLKKSLKELNQSLAEFGLSLGMKLDDKTLAEIKKRIPPQFAKRAEAPPAVQPVVSKPVTESSPSMQDFVEKLKQDLKARPVANLPPFASVKDGMVLETNLPKREVQDALDMGLKIKPLKSVISQAKAELSRIGELVNAQAIKALSEVVGALGSALNKEANISAAIPALVKALGDRRADVRENAAAALEKAAKGPSKLSTGRNPHG